MEGSNGAEGWAGENAYLQLWKAEELVEYNRGSCVGEFMPGAFPFGSSGGGMAYAFDTRSDPMMIVEVPWEVLGWKDVWERWDSFADFLLGLSTREPDDESLNLPGEDD